MKKEIKETVPQASEQPATNVRSYFTKEINTLISEMEVKEMESLMREFINSRTWIALLKYTSMRTPLLDNVLRATDPVKDPSKISWSQGCQAGLCDIETYVIDLNAPAPAQTEPEENINDGPEGLIG